MKDEDGKVVTAPRGFYTARLKKGRTDKILFSKPGYNCLGDPYNNVVTTGGRTFEHEGFRKAGHDFNFKPARTVHTKVANKLPYPYMP